MGQITIEIPQKMSRHFHLASEDSVKEVLSKLEQLIKNELRFDEEEDILGLWADGKETKPERTREPRRNSNDRLLIF